MKAMVLNRYGAPGVLHWSEVPPRPVGLDDVMVRVYATSVNPIDWKVRKGLLQDRLPLSFPAIIGWDAAGVIEEVGSNVSKFRVGDKVFTRPAIDRAGTYAEFVVVNEGLIAKKPDNLSFLEAAGVPLAGLTAWEALVEIAGIKAGQRILIHGGAGGVGSYAIQLAKAKGAEVVTTSSPVHQEYVTDLGADVIVDYRSEAFDEVLKDVDIVFDTVGGDVQTRSYRVLKPEGVLVSIVQDPDQELARAYRVRAQWFFLEPDGKKLEALAQLFEEGHMRPVIGTAFPLSDVVKAHEFSETGHVQGKIGLIVDTSRADNR